MKISACIIAKNEEKNIETCINSYKNIVDEIIVVDTGSEDKTVEIAKSLGARVYFFKWINDFAAAKNYAIDKAKGDWIIFLDADEYFEEASSEKIKNILQKLQNTKYSAVGCKIINIDKTNDKIIDTFLQTRIFKNRNDIRYRSSIHEVIYSKKEKLELISYYDEITIYHTGYSANITQNKAERNLKLLLDKMEGESERPDYYRYLCDCYFSLNNYEEALKYGELHVKSGIKALGYHSRVIKVIIDCMWNLKKPKEEIESKIKEAIDMFPDHPNFYCTYAFFLMDERRFEEALENFLKTIKYNNSYEGIEVNLILGALPDVYNRIGFIYNLKKCYEKALENFCECLKIDKYNSETFKSMFQLIKSQDPENIIYFINSKYNTNDEKDVKFIIDELVKIKPKEVLAYYTNIWYKKFGHEDYAMTFTLLAEGRYETVFKLFFKVYMDKYDDSDAILSIVSGVLSDNVENIKKLINEVKPSYKRILKAYFNENNILYEIDLEDYISILRELVLFDKQDIIDKFVSISNRFNINIQSKIASVFRDNLMYEDALNYYKQYNINFENKNTLMNIGYCSYKLGYYKNAYEYIQKAVQEGYTENDAHEILNWINEKVNIGKI